MAEKDPQKDVQVAAVVAYFYRFEAPPSERKDSINRNDLQEAMRLAGRPRFKKPLQNYQLCRYRRAPRQEARRKPHSQSIQSAKNLVAMTLPGSGKTPYQGQKMLRRRLKRRPWA